MERWLFPLALSSQLVPLPGSAAGGFARIGCAKWILSTLRRQRLDAVFAWSSVALSDLELIAIDDDASIGRDVNLQPAHIRGGMLFRQPIHIGSHCIVGSHASVLGGARIAAGTHIPSLAVVGGSPHPSSTNSSADTDGVQQHEFPTTIGPIYKALGYLIVGYLTAAAIFVGIMFVRTAVTALGADVPSISEIAFGEASPSSVPLAFFAAVAIALYLVMPVCYLFRACGHRFKRFLLGRLETRTDRCEIVGRFGRIASFIAR